MKENGFNRLLTVSVADWLEKGTFEVYFLVHNMIENIHVKVATEITRENPQIPSLSSFWPNAAMHERESWNFLE
ncbi:hypothetical protein DRO59_09385 [Candidatus Bathyarchaeota archaeon]|nr:MAG: hypothetical protein DRO59_09385 [Candidatus Bathyarchaeota archaeon]